MNQELKPCPFCGSKAQLESINECPSVYSVTCPDAYCATFKHGNSREAATEAWNSRVQTDEKCVSKDDAMIPPPTAPLLVRPDKEQEEESEEEFCEKVEELNSSGWKKIASLQAENEELKGRIYRANLLIGSQADENDKIVASLESRLAAKCAECEKYREALERLASNQAFDMPRVMNNEDRMRMEFAEAALQESKHPSPPSPHPSAK